MRAEKPVSIRRDWCAKTLAGTVLGFALALIASDLFSTLANDIPAAIRAQLAMWMVVPLWVAVLGGVYAFASGLRAWCWLGAVTLGLYAAGWLAKL